MNDDERTPELAPYAALVDAMIEHWRGLAKSPSQQRAYLLFNRWEDNPLAQSLQSELPKWARDRFAVPDQHFEHRIEHAPFVLELPEELLVPAAAAAAQCHAIRKWMAQCLRVAASQVAERTTPQDFCGVVISPASAQAIAGYWLGLGDQRPPYQDNSVLFRYQDPRVMQRVWPALSPLQQSRWLGPITHWWSLLQPWGPFTAAKPMQWFQAKVPDLPHGVQAGGSVRDLFDEPQWILSGSSPQANRIWRSYADNHIAPPAQPDSESLLWMLADAARMGLAGLNIEDYVWITWQHAPKEGSPHALDWSMPHLAPTLKRIEAQLRIQPDARFSSLFVEAIQTRS